MVVGRAPAPQAAVCGGAAGGLSSRADESPADAIPLPVYLYGRPRLKDSGVAAEPFRPPTPSENRRCQQRKRPPRRPPWTATS